MKYSIPKELYPKTAILKAAYSFTDRAYILIRQDTENYIIDFEAKEDTSPIIESDFKNELLAQALRSAVVEQTAEIRKLISARALASTIINEPTINTGLLKDYPADEILKDWYENEKSGIRL